MTDTDEIADGSLSIGEAVQRDGARNFFNLTERAFSLLGFDTAAENLRRYRSGEGATQTYSSEEIDRHPAFADAEDANRTRFESQTFTGSTRDKALNARVLDPEDGQTVEFEDSWTKSTNGFGNPFDNQEERLIISRPSTYFAFGRTGTRSVGQFEATRQGDNVIITGAVTHGMTSPRVGQDTETFDFNPGQIGDEQSVTLERAGEAAPFGMRYERSQDVSALLRRSPDGSLTLRGVTWGALR